MSASGMMLGVFTVVGMSAGQLLFKLAARQIRTEQILLSPYLWIAVCLYGAVTLAWILLLREIDLASAYPLLAACYVLVPIGSALILGEHLSPMYGLGVLLILVGIFVTLRS